MFNDGIYRSMRPAPTLLECLRATHRSIQRQYKARVEERERVSLQDAWNGVYEWLDKPNNNASRLDFFLQMPPTPAPEAFNALSLAMAYWIEAHKAKSADDDRRGWSALVQSNYYLGMASGPNSMIENSAQGGLAQGEAFQELHSKVIEWLKELPDNTFSSVKTAIDALSKRTKAFEPKKSDEQKKKGGKLSHGRTTSPLSLLRRWSINDTEVRAEFSRVAGGIRKGRKKKVSDGPLPSETSI
jgi:hypothetical protein